MRHDRSGVFFNAARVLVKRGVFLALVCLASCTADVGTNDSTDDMQSLTAVRQIDCGGGATGAFAADQFFSGGSTYANTHTITTSGVTNAAPAAVYRSERYGNHTYTFSGLTAGQAYTVRLHFAEIYWTRAGARVFNTIINETQVLTKFDIFATAGANKAVVRDFTTMATTAGQIAIQYLNVTDNAKSSGIEILSNGVVTNPAPTLSAIAPSTGSSGGGTTTTLSGANFVSGATVTFCGTASNATFVSASQLTAGTPAHAAGACDVVVRNPDGQTATLTGAFTFTVPTCVPTTCAAQGKNCGSMSDGCGGSLTCGVCSSPATCGGGGTPNVCGSSSGGRTYSTTFDLTEDPISESGNWINGAVVGLDWGNAATSGGFAQSRLNNGGGPSYNDTTALLTGAWGANQSVTATLHRGGGVVEGDYPEVEIRLHSSLSAHSCTGYEIMWSLRSDASCYVAIVRWNGAFGDFTVLKGDSGSQYVLGDGAKLKATIVAGDIKAYIGNQLVLEFTDTTYSGGTPGMGFDHNGGNSDDAQFGFTDYTATDSF